MMHSRRAALLSRCLPQPDRNDNYFDVKKDYDAIQEAALLSHWLYVPEEDRTYTTALLLKCCSLTVECMCKTLLIYVEGSLYSQKIPLRKEKGSNGCL